LLKVSENNVKWHFSGQNNEFMSQNDTQQSSKYENRGSIWQSLLPLAVEEVASPGKSVMLQVYVKVSPASLRLLKIFSTDEM